MPDLRLQSEASGDVGYRTGPGGTGAGVDVLAELERVRESLVAACELLEVLRAKYNAHTHNGAVAAPPAGEQSAVAWTVG